jgi:hypothetical protein
MPRPRYKVRKHGKKYTIYDSKYKYLLREQDKSMMLFKTEKAAEKAIKEIIS